MTIGYDVPDDWEAEERKERRRRLGAIYLEHGYAAWIRARNDEYEQAEKLIDRWYTTGKSSRSQ